MYVYYIKGFPGHYPVGTSAIIVASDRLEAFSLLASKLKVEHFLELGIQDVNMKDFIQLDTTDAHAVVLQDGDY